MAPPASGKTTTISILMELLNERKLVTCLINDKDVLKDICQKKKSSMYFFTKEGAVVIMDEYRDLMLEKMYQSVRQRLEDVNKTTNICFVEFTSPDWCGVLKKYFSDFLVKNDCIGLIIWSDKENFKRNKNRNKEDAIPDTYIKLFDKKTNDELKKTKVFFDGYWEIDNRGSFDSLRDECRNVVDKII